MTATRIGLLSVMFDLSAGLVIDEVLVPEFRGFGQKDAMTGWREFNQRQPASEDDGKDGGRRFAFPPS
jgi:hypothetical protein